MTASLTIRFVQERMRTAAATWRTLLPAIAIIAGLITAGCSGSPPAEDERAAETREPQDEGNGLPLVPPLPEPVSDAAALEQTEATANGGSSDGSGTVSGLSVAVLDWEETQALLAEHRGKVVVVDVWSTYCEPCLREFPNLVALQQRYRNEVACIAVNTNYEGLADEPPESFREEIRRFATQQDAHFQHVLLSVPAEEFYDEIDLGGPPAVFVYDKQGKLAKRFDNSDLSSGEFTYDKDVLPLVEELIASR